MPTFMVNAIRMGIREYETVLNFSISEQANNDVDTELRFGLITRDTENDPVPPAYANLPVDDDEGEQDNWTSGDMFFNTRSFGTVPLLRGVPFQSMVGTFQYHTILQETGHALGLRHGHQDDGNPFGRPLPSAWDSMEFTVMTYRSYVGDPLTNATYSNARGDYAQTLMMLDIQALQTLYGADFTTQSTDTTYRWDTNGLYSINGMNQWQTDTGTIFLTIWDGGGNDTYDFSAFSTPTFIDLRPGEFSNLGTQIANLGDGRVARGNVFNALQFQGSTASLIENAIGGSGDDSISGNAAFNRLDGGNGNDDLLGFFGDDLLIGGIGSDELYGGLSNDRLIGGGGDDLINGGEGFDLALYVAATGETVDITPFGKVSNGLWRVDGPAEAAGDILAQIEGFVFGDGGDIVTINDTSAAVTFEIDGGKGGDILRGSDGLSDIETLIGGAGTDRVDPGHGKFFAFGGERGSLPGTWIESLSDGDVLILIRSDFGANYSFTLQNAVSLGSYLGSDGSTSRGFARINYFGSGFNDRVDGALGDDLFEGLGGMDVFLGGEGNDTIDGGGAADTLIGGNGIDGIFGGTGADVIEGGSGNDVIETGGGLDQAIFGGSGDDTIIGSADAEQLNGGEDNDTLDGLEGADTLNGGLGSDPIFGGDGNDVIDSGLGAGKETIDGGDDFDSLRMDRSATTLGVTFFLNGAAGSDGTTTKGIEDLTYFAGSGTNRIVGGDGVDRINGNIGRDTLTGGLGADSLNGGNGVDRLFGGLGADSITGGDGGDRIETGGGGGGNFGGSGNDTMIGSDDADFMRGDDDRDTLRGFGGDDQLNGGEDNDKLDGGSGSDQLDVTFGNDTLIFSDGIGVDSVFGFDSDAAGGQDLIDVKAFNFGGFAAMLASGVTVAAFGSTTIITFGLDRPVVQLFGVLAATVDASDFLF